MPWFEVNITSSLLCAIEADTEEEAIDFARDEITDSTRGHHDFDSKPVRDAEEIARLRRHADYVSEA